MESPLRYFSSLTDPRVERTREHDMEEFGKSKAEWLKGFLRLPEGIPSPRYLQPCFFRP
jgi:hypothetical protein